VDLSDRYSRIDRALHRVAFKTAPIQIELAAIENRIFKKRLEGIEARRPVFITSLPRAGTTVLLQLLSGLEEFASNTYRDMPFVLLPLMWHPLARNARDDRLPMVERAHGDGILVGLDSAEAFEEMFWRAWWPEHYRSDRIVPWTGCDDEEFIELFRNHLRKVIWLRRGPSGAEARYVSKNNGNIARIEALYDCCPDALVLVPVREPVQQALSLLRQHRRFLEMHTRDTFAGEYMKGICHFDFGENLRPIDLGAWLDSANHRDPLTVEFWLEYWVGAFEQLLEKRGGQGQRLQFLPFDAFCEDPATGLRWLAGQLECRDADALVAQQHTVRAPRRHDSVGSVEDRELLDRVKDVYARVMAASDMPRVSR